MIFIKHAFLPMLLSAAVDAVWIDFDTFILKAPLHFSFFFLWFIDARTHRGP